MLYINGVKMPDPSVFRTPEYDLDSENSGRNERGVMIRDRLRQGMYKVELEWWAINNNEVERILNAIKPSKVTVRFLDSSGYETKTMYAGDRQKELVRFMGSKNKMAWNLSLNLIEM